MIEPLDLQGVSCSPLQLMCVSCMTSPRSVRVDLRSVRKRTAVNFIMEVGAIFLRPDESGAVYCMSEMYLLRIRGQNRNLDGGCESVKSF